MTQLVHYEAARRALDAAVKFDDVMVIKNVAEQAALYAKQAKDNDLIQKATEIKVRAERKAGEMLRQAAEQGHRATVADGVKRGANKHSSRDATSAPTLSEIGVTKSESSRYQQLAAMPDEHFETAVATAKATAGEVTTAFMLREAKKHRPIAKPNRGPKAKAMLRDLDEAQAQGSTVTVHAKFLIAVLKRKKSFNEEETALLKELRALLAPFSETLQ